MYLQAQPMDEPHTLQTQSVSELRLLDARKPTLQPVAHPGRHASLLADLRRCDRVVS
ncbi:hypothetical protein DPMN_157836, partial [Dreissena polymorpha]